MRKLILIALVALLTTGCLPGLGILMSGAPKMTEGSFKYLAEKCMREYRTPVITTIGDQTTFECRIEYDLLYEPETEGK